MEELKNNKIYKFLFIVFILVSIINIGYATVTMRGLYEDGSFTALQLLDNISNNRWEYIFDYFHPRFMGHIFVETPMLFSGLVLGVDDKFTLLKIYSFAQFIIPLLALLWNFQLTKRTGKLDVLFWSIFTYGAILLPFSIFSVVEIYIGATLQLVLWNYLVSDIDYKKRDILAIFLLFPVMFFTYEYVIALGLIIFFAHFYYVNKLGNSIKKRCIKHIIGVGSLLASVYNVWFVLKTPGEAGEIFRFIEEAYNFYTELLNLNTILTIATIILLIGICFSKKKINTIFFALMVIIYSALFIRLLVTPDTSVVPMWEQHLRTVPCWALPLIFIGMIIRDVVSKEINLIKYTNCIIVALLCCIFQTVWQWVNTFYWNENIQYMKIELAEEDSKLYVPSEHEELSGFFNETLRRYIWHGTYTATSIILSDEYEQKTLLMVYDEPLDPGNLVLREYLYYDEFDRKISVPFGSYVDVKNKFWDLTKCAEALNTYNEENNIETLKEKH